MNFSIDFFELNSSASLQRLYFFPWIQLLAPVPIWNGKSGLPTSEVFLVTIRSKYLTANQIFRFLDNTFPNDICQLNSNPHPGVTNQMSAPWEKKNNELEQK